MNNKKYNHSRIHKTAQNIERATKKLVIQRVTVWDQRIVGESYVKVVDVYNQRNWIESSIFKGELQQKWEVALKAESYEIELYCNMKNKFQHLGTLTLQQQKNYQQFYFQDLPQQLIWSIHYHFIIDPDSPLRSQNHFTEQTVIFENHPKNKDQHQPSQLIDNMSIIENKEEHNISLEKHGYYAESRIEDNEILNQLNTLNASLTNQLHQYQDEKILCTQMVNDTTIFNKSYKKQEKKDSKKQKQEAPIKQEKKERKIQKQQPLQKSVIEEENEELLNQFNTTKQKWFSRKYKNSTMAKKMLIRRRLTTVTQLPEIQPKVITKLFNSSEENQQTKRIISYFGFTGKLAPSEINISLENLESGENMMVANLKTDPDQNKLKEWNFNVEAPIEGALIVEVIDRKNVFYGCIGYEEESLGYCSLYDEEGNEINNMNFKMKKAENIIIQTEDVLDELEENKNEEDENDKISSQNDPGSQPLTKEQNIDKGLPRNFQQKPSTNQQRQIQPEKSEPKNQSGKDQTQIINSKIQKSQLIKVQTNLSPKSEPINRESKIANHTPGAINNQLINEWKIDNNQHQNTHQRKTPQPILPRIKRQYIPEYLKKNKPGLVVPNSPNHYTRKNTDYDAINEEEQPLPRTKSESLSKLEKDIHKFKVNKRKTAQVSEISNNSQTIFDDYVMSRNKYDNIQKVQESPSEGSREQRQEREQNFGIHLFKPANTEEQNSRKQPEQRLLSQKIAKIITKKKKISFTVEAISIELNNPITNRKFLKFWIEGYQPYISETCSQVTFPFWTGRGYFFENVSEFAILHVEMYSKKGQENNFEGKSKLYIAEISFKDNHKRTISNSSTQFLRNSDHEVIGNMILNYKCVTKGAKSLYSKKDKYSIDPQSELYMPEKTRRKKINRSKTKNSSTLDKYEQEHKSRRNSFNRFSTKLDNIQINRPNILSSNVNLAKSYKGGNIIIPKSKKFAEQKPRLLPGPGTYNVGSCFDRYND